MPGLGELLELTLAGRAPAAALQVAPGGAQLQWLGEGALRVTPAPGRDAGLDLVFSAGVHGCEVIPIQLLDRLIQAIARGELQPRARLLLLFCNVPAMRAGVRLCGEDLNRLFCGAHRNASSAEARRAAELEGLVAGFFATPGRTRRHYDLHSAMRASRLQQFAICPWVDGRPVSTASLQRLAIAGVSAVLLKEKSAATFSAYSATRHGAEAFTLEMAEAQEGAWPECLDRFLQAAGAWIEGRDWRAGHEPLLFRLAFEVVKGRGDFRLCLPTDVQNFERLPSGTLLAEEGERRWVIEGEQQRVLFPLPEVAIGERAALVVEPWPRLPPADCSASRCR